MSSSDDTQKGQQPHVHFRKAQTLQPGHSRHVIDYIERLSNWNPVGMSSDTESGNVNIRPRRRTVSEMTHPMAEQVLINRPIFSQKEFDEGHGFENEKPPIKERIRKSIKKTCQCTAKGAKRMVMQRLPFVRFLRYYKFPRWVPGDLIGGITLGIMHIPQSIAYAMLAGLPPIMGLYTSFFPTLLYFFFGTSRHVSVGTESVIALMIGSVMDRETHDFHAISGMNETLVPDEELMQYKMGVGVTLAFLTGVWQLIMSFLGLGFLANYLSDTLISGFTTGAAMLTFTSQIKYVFGVSLPHHKRPFKMLKIYGSLFENLFNTNVAELIISLICIASMFFVKEVINTRCQKTKYKLPVPIELIVVVAGTVVSYTSNLPEKYDVKIVGDIPTGMPTPALPIHHISEVGLIGDAFWIALVAFTISVSLAKLLGKLHDYEVNPGQELFAYGVANTIGSMFSCFSASASMSRSFVQHSVGTNTQVSGFISSCIVLIVMLFVGPLFRTLPRCILACIVLVALKGMFMQYKDIIKLWKISKYDFAMWIVMYSSVVLLGVDTGLLIGVGFSLLTVIVRQQRPYTCLYGRVSGTDIYRDKTKYKKAEEIDGIKIFHFESSLYYANADHFKTQLYQLTNANPLALKKARKRHGKKKSRFEKKVQRDLEKKIKKEEENMHKLEDLLSKIEPNIARLVSCNLSKSGSHPSLPYLDDSICIDDNMHNTSIGSNSHSGGSGNNNNFGFAVRHLPMDSQPPPLSRDNQQQSRDSQQQSRDSQQLPPMIAEGQPPTQVRERERPSIVRQNTHFNMSIAPVTSPAATTNTNRNRMFGSIFQFNSKAGHPPVVLEMNEEEDQDNDRHNMSMDTDYNEDDDLPAFDEEPPNFDIHHIIIDCSAMMYTDAVGVKVLTQVISDYQKVDVHVLLADCRANYRDMLGRIGFFEHHSNDIMYITIHDAVMHAESEYVLKEDVSFNNDNVSVENLSSSGIDETTTTSSDHGIGTRRSNSSNSQQGQPEKEVVTAPTIAEAPKQEGNVNEGFSSDTVSDSDVKIEVSQEKFFIPPPE